MESNQVNLQLKKGKVKTATATITPDMSSELSKKLK